METKQHILIIGAGVTGLLIAQGLQQVDIPFTIFDSEADGSNSRAREWTMILHWSLPLIRKLLPVHLAARLKEDASVDPTVDYDAYPCNVIRIYNGDDGTIGAELPIKDSAMRVTRKKLRALCAEGINVRYDHKLQSVDVAQNEGKVTASFTNGTSVSGTMLIGADGAKSYVRDFLFGPGNAPITPLGLPFFSIVTNYRTAEDALKVRSAAPIFSIMVRPGNFALLSTYEIPDEAKPETWRFHLAVNWPRDENVDVRSLSNAEKHRLLKKKGAGLVEPFRTALLEIPEDVQIPTDDIGYWISEAWDTRVGLVTLAGDSSHPMTPNRGQGCNNAVQTAYNLVMAIHGIEQGGVQHQLVQECAEECARRGGAEAKLSYENAYAMMDWETVKESPMFKHSLSARHQGAVEG